MNNDQLTEQQDQLIDHQIEQAEIDIDKYFDNQGIVKVGNYRIHEYGFDKEEITPDLIQAIKDNPLDVKSIKPLQDYRNEIRTLVIRSRLVNVPSDIKDVNIENLRDTIDCSN